MKKTSPCHFASATLCGMLLCPVSYTHLDVYKRQPLVRTLQRAWPGPVSYTHLDVYKRQV